ncbi:hypothetical protein GCM10020255_027020 [Rhodococcus baikonurensis]
MIYRALVERLRLQLPIELQSRRPHSEFEAAPYDNDNNAYICSTDITAYYQYIDHDVLADELTAQTGDYHTVNALISLLEQVMGTRVGIPQVHASSDTLGDTYIDPIRRTLIREGYDAYVYADDFRIGCSSSGRHAQRSNSVPTQRVRWVWFSTTRRLARTNARPMLRRSNR